ncbi:hypothetical protein HANVADRAFT_54029 [Hanseniaspora valbyensis NRRL Y-1626]|uniref:Uncharacterized protein n=1 Tax=Hanseniaspora valbyensis NRRL Y-1626 TaxID=766949 RepID=A0A1B7T949_9ASCO|nr:hypothetical protein HANVADRAFT_54029 [Hanseniaspora valbyensis NRRL Y-1626]
MPLSNTLSKTRSNSTESSCSSLSTDFEEVLKEQNFEHVYLFNIGHLDDGNKTKLGNKSETIFAKEEIEKEVGILPENFRAKYFFYCNFSKNHEKICAIKETATELKYHLMNHCASCLKCPNCGNEYFNKKQAFVHLNKICKFSCTESDLEKYFKLKIDTPYLNFLNRSNSILSKVMCKKEFDNILSNLQQKKLKEDVKNITIPTKPLSLKEWIFFKNTINSNILPSIKFIKKQVYTNLLSIYTIYLERLESESNRVLEEYLNNHSLLTNSDSHGIEYNDSLLSTHESDYADNEETDSSTEAFDQEENFDIINFYDTNSSLSDITIQYFQFENSSEESLNSIPIYLNSDISTVITDGYSLATNFDDVANISLSSIISNTSSMLEIETISIINSSTEELQM